MKLERYKDKKETRKKVLLIVLTVLTIVSITMMLYKTFAKFTTTTSFPIMSGKVKYKPKGKDLADIPLVQGTEDGLYAVTPTGPSDDWAQTEYRYAGANPKNYVYFNCKDGTDLQNATNCEKWRIIGKVNVKLKSGTIEQRIKIIRPESIGNYAWDYNGRNDWTRATLMGMLNQTYYYSENDNTYCYEGLNKITCNFEQNQSIRGLSSKARDMIESDPLSWNMGAVSFRAIPKNSYYGERGNIATGSHPLEWNIDTTKNPSNSSPTPTLYRGVGLLYPSDYGYAVGGSIRNTCINYTEFLDYETDCVDYDWLRAKTSQEWYITTSSDGSKHAIEFTEDGRSTYYMTYFSAGVRPVVFLTSKVRIGEGEGTELNPYQLVA